MEQRAYWESNSSSASQKFPTFHVTRRFITPFTRVRNLSVWWARSMNFHVFKTQFLNIHLNIILQSMSGLSSCLFPNGFLTNAQYAPLSTENASCPAHLILLYIISRKLVDEGYISLSFSLCSFFHSPVTSCLWSILLSTLFSNIHSLPSSLNMRDQVSHTYKTTSKIIVLNILSF